MSDQSTRPLKEHIPDSNDRDSMLRAVALLEQSQSWGYRDRDLLCRLLQQLIIKVYSE